MEALLSDIDESKMALHQKLREMDLFEADIQKNDGLEAQLEYRKEQIKEQIALLNSEIQHQEVRIKLLEKNQHVAKEKLEVLRRQLEELNISKERLEQDKVILEKYLMNMQQNVLQTERQLKWLRQIKEENEGYFSSVKQVLNVVKSNKAQWQGVIGIVGELLEVPKDYEIAIVTALGGAIQNIVTESEKDARQMIEMMKKRGIARVTFLPLDTIKPGQPIHEHGLKNEVGFLGFASDLISFDPKYTTIVSSLLGRIIIVDQMDNASRIAKNYGYRYKLVTLEGEVFNSGGSLSGGSTKNKKNNLFSRARELKENEEKLKTLNSEYEITTQKLQELTVTLEDTIYQYQEANRKNMSLSDEDKNYELEIEKNTHALKLTKANQLQLMSERSNVEESLEKIKEGKEEARGHLVELKESLSVHEATISKLEERLVQSRIEREELEKQLTDKRIGLSNTLQNIHYMVEQIAEIEKALYQHDEKSQYLNEAIDKHEAKITQLKEENKKIAQQIKEDSRLIEEAQETRKAYDEKKQTLEKDEEKLLQGTGRINEKIDLLKEERYRLEKKKES